MEIISEKKEIEELRVHFSQVFYNRNFGAGCGC